VWTRIINFEPHLYLYTYPSSLIPVIFLVHTTYEDGTECSETSAHKTQTPGNHPKKEYNILLATLPAVKMPPEEKTSLPALELGEPE
jgi:hypothetical protein